MTATATVVTRALLVVLAASLLPQTALGYQQEARLTPWLRWIGA